MILIEFNVVVVFNKELQILSEQFYRWITNNILLNEVVLNKYKEIYESAQTIVVE